MTELGGVLVEVTDTRAAEAAEADEAADGTVAKFLTAADFKIAFLANGILLVTIRVVVISIMIVFFVSMDWSGRKRKEGSLFLFLYVVNLIDLTLHAAVATVHWVYRRCNVSY